MIYYATVCFRDSNPEIKDRHTHTHTHIYIHIYVLPDFLGFFFSSLQMPKKRIWLCPRRFWFRTSPYYLMVVLLPSWAINKCRALQNEMMHIAWCCLEEVPYCFWRSSVKFQDHTALKIVEFDLNWAFLDCNSSLNSPMATKWCTKLEVA